MRCSSEKCMWGRNNLYKDTISESRVVQEAELMGGSQRMWTME